MEALYYLGVKAVIVRDDGQMMLLSIQRKNSDETYWDLPGGRSESDELPLDTLKREVREETGITQLDDVKHLGMAVSSIKLPGADGRPVGIVFSLYTCHTAATQVTPEDRITIHWCSPQETSDHLKENSDWPAELAETVAGLALK